MTIYAQIRNKKIRLIEDWLEMPYWGTWIDLTGYDPQPTVGQLYNSGTGEFTDPPPEPRWINNYDLWDRLYETEQENLQELSWTNKKAARFLYELRIHPKINKDNQRVVNAFNQLESAGVIGPGRAGEILT